jgi:hypothetical protein
MTRLICGFRLPQVLSKGEALESVKHYLNLFRENTDIEIRDE